MNFDKPVGEWIEEEIEVPTFEAEVDNKGKVVGLKKTVKKMVEKTRYDEVPFKKFSCASGDHYWTMRDKRKHVAGCTKCTKNLFVQPIKHKIKDGKILDRDTGQVLID